MAAILAGLLPIFVGVVVWSMAFFSIGFVFRLRNWSFETALRLVLYMTVGTACVMVAAEEVAKDFGVAPSALLNATAPVAGVFVVQFVFRALRGEQPGLSLAGVALTFGTATAAFGYFA